jgi:hypothetical protein
MIIENMEGHSAAPKLSFKARVLTELSYLWTRQALKYFLSGLVMQGLIVANTLNAVNELYLSILTVSLMITFIWMIQVEFIHIKDRSKFFFMATMGLGNAIGSILGTYIHHHFISH